jgi:voltage-gated potassium channel
MRKPMPRASISSAEPKAAGSLKVFSVFHVIQYSTLIYHGVIDLKKFFMVSYNYYGVRNMKYALRLKLYNLIRDDYKNNLASNILDSIIIFLIILNAAIIILDTFRIIDMHLKDMFSIIEFSSILIFTVEYLARVWTSIYIYPKSNPVIARIRYMFTFMAIIDLLAIAPFYLPFLFPIHNLLFLRIIRLLRIFRLFKLIRYTDALNHVGKVIKHKSNQLISSLCFVFILMIFASVFMYYVEHDDQPQVFENAFSGLWWAIATVTTIGYGDIYPITGLGRFLGAFIAMLGIALIAVPTGIISAGFIEESDAKINRTNLYVYRRNRNKYNRFIKRKKRW